MKRIKIEFTLLEYLSHIKSWLYSFPNPFNIYDHLIIGVAGESSASCLICNAKFNENASGENFRITEEEYKKLTVSKKKKKRKNQ